MMKVASPVIKTRAPHHSVKGTTGRSVTVPATCSLKDTVLKNVTTVALTSVLLVGGASARLEGVNKPEFLPPGPPTPVLDVAGFLTEGEETRIKTRVQSLEKDTGIRLRVLAQNYPETPGLAIRDYWAVDDDTVVFVADPMTGNILNFNVGSNVDLRVPRNFFTRVAGKFGTKFYWQEKGENMSILNAVAAIDACVREEPGRNQCSSIYVDVE